jgi:hypothetical protein
MNRGTRLLSVALLMVVALAACGDDNPPSAGDGTPTPTPTSSTFEEAEWTIVTPAGWTKEDITATADAKKAIRYKAASGEFFIVAIDPEGSDFEYDALWRYEVTGSGFEVVSKTECKGTSDMSCKDDDARYDGYVLWKSGVATPPPVGGHTWYFIFGDADGTTVDAALFEQIVESIRAKA